MKILTGALAALLLSAGAAFAGDWAEVGRDSSAVNFIEAGQVEVRGDSRFVRVITVTNQGAQVQGHGVAYFEARLEYDCTGHRRKILAVSFYDEAFNVVAATDQADQDWRDYEESSLAAGDQAYACAAPGKRPAPRIKNSDWKVFGPAELAKLRAG